MRVNELAKEIGKTSKEVLDVLQKENQDVKSHSSNITDAQVGMVKRHLMAPEIRRQREIHRKRNWRLYIVRRTPSSVRLSALRTSSVLSRALQRVRRVSRSRAALRQARLLYGRRQLRQHRLLLRQQHRLKIRQQDVR